MTIKEIISRMTLEEKASLCSGAEMFATQAIERLGIPAVELADGPHGLRKQEGQKDHLGRNQSVVATCFPAACATGSGWDTELITEMGHALGRICQSKNVQVLLGPGVNIKRSPLCGRNFEYFSEDPYLSGVMGTAYVKAVQAEGIGTSLKHFLANNQENRRRTQNSQMDERTLREIYAPAFEKVIKEAQPWTVMAAYNKVDGTYMTENTRLLRTLLREEWGYEGMVVSDWMAVHDRVAVIKGGCALTMPDNKAGDHLLVEAVQNGTLNEAELDECCAQIIQLALKSAAGRKEGTAYDFEEAHTLARKIAAECMVLLKNEDQMLPLNPRAKIAVIGKFAESPRYQGAGSSQINAYKVPSLLDVTADMENVVYSEGFGMGGKTNPEMLAAAVETAKNADVAVIVAGLPPVLESEGYDRWIMKLPVCQNELIEAVCAVQPNTVVVLQNGSPVELPWKEEPKAILESYLGGEAVSEAIWDVLTGAVNPSGHLAESFPVKYEDNPSYLFWPGEGDDVKYSEGVFVGYRYYTTKNAAVAYPFGHGLSYTTFDYSNLTLDKNTFAADETLTASVTVTNTGSRAGKALVQLYVETDIAATGVRRPVRELRAFEKILLQPGESKTIAMKLDKRAFAYWDTSCHNWRIAGGEYQVQICANAQNALLSQSVKVQDEYIPKKSNYNIMSPIADIIKHPLGKELYEKILPVFMNVVKKMGVMGSQPQEMPYEELRPNTMGLMAEPLQTLQRFAPNMTDADWDKFFREINGD